MTRAIISTIICFSIVLTTQIAHASKADLDKFYKPVTSRDLITVLSPAVRNHARDNKRFGNDSNLDGFLFSDRQGCPDSISIGSPSGDAPIYGGIDINVVITGDIIVSCGMP